MPQTIIDHEGRTWTLETRDTGARGEECLKYRLAENARVIWMHQRTGPDDPWVDTFHVERLANHWTTASEAIAIERVNP